MIYAANNPAFCKKRFYYMVAVGLLQSLLSIALGAIDMVLAGYFFGVSGVSAITVSAPLSQIFIFIIMILVNGCRIVYPEEIGRYDKEAANQYFSTALTISILFSVISLVMMLFVGNKYLDLVHISGDTLKLAREYLKYYKYVCILIPFSNFVGQMVYCDGDMKLCTTSNIFFLVGNLIFSVIGAIFLGMGGIALATLVSGLGCLIINSLHFFKKTCVLKYQFYFSFKKQLKLIRYSFIDSTFSLFSGINGFIITTFIIKHFGSDYLAVNSVAGQALGLSGLFSSTSEAMMPILNTYNGEKNNDGVKKIFKVAFKWTIISGLILTSVVLFMAPLFPKIFSLSVPELSGACITGVKLVSLTFVFLSIMTVLPMYYNALGHIILSTVIARFKDSILYIILFVVCGSLFGVNGIWIGTMLCPIVAFVFALVLFKIMFGKKNFLLLENDNRDIKSWDLKLSTESIINLRDQVSKYLADKSFPERTIYRVALLIEELYLLVLEKNKQNQKILAELTVFCDGDTDIELIFRDDGIILDLTDADIQISSLRGYVFTRFSETIDLKSNATSVSFNRNRFVCKNI